MRVKPAQPDLCPAPGEIGFLRAQDGTNGVSNPNEAADDARVLGWNTVRALAVADRNGDRRAVRNLGEPVLDDQVAALLDRRAFGRGADADGLVEQGFVVGLRRRRGHIDVGGKRVERREQVLNQGLLSALSRQISIGDFRRRIRPRELVIREQKQWNSCPPWWAIRQYRIYSDNASTAKEGRAGRRRLHPRPHAWKTSRCPDY